MTEILDYKNTRIQLALIRMIFNFRILRVRNFIMKMKIFNSKNINKTNILKCKIKALFFLFCNGFLISGCVNITFRYHSVILSKQK